MKNMVWDRGGHKRQLKTHLPYWKTDRYETEKSKSSTINMLFRDILVNIDKSVIRANHLAFRK